MQIIGIEPSFWRARRVFITGHSGFFGGWLSLWLQRLGAEVTGYSLAPTSQDGFCNTTRLWQNMQSITADVRDPWRLRAAIHSSDPEIVFHLAAQPLVRRAHADPIATYDTNVMGTVNLMDALRDLPSLGAAVVVTTDKVYDNAERDAGYAETDRLGAREPYGASKACAELIVESHRHSYLAGENAPGVATVRAGNIVGGGDWGEDRLIPDAIRAFSTSRPMTLRNPSAVRPWQHVLDPARGLLMLAERLANDPKSHSQPWNLGPAETEVHDVASVAEEMARLWGDGASWKDISGGGGQPYEAHRLTLNSEKAAQRIGWRPLWSLQRTLAATVDWYKAHLAGDDMHRISLDQIAAYEGTN